MPEMKWNKTRLDQGKSELLLSKNCPGFSRQFYGIRWFGHILALWFVKPIWQT